MSVLTDLKTSKWDYNLKMRKVLVASLYLKGPIICNGGSTKNMKTFSDLLDAILNDFLSKTNCQ